MDVEVLRREGVDEKGIETLILDRPETINSLNGTMVSELAIVLREISEDSSVRVLRIKGQGRGFMAGGDLRWFAGMFEAEPDPQRRQEVVLEEIRKVHESIQLIDAMEFPVVAQVHGACAGFGLSLATACDLVMCASDCKVTLAYSGIGTSPDGGSTFQLLRRVGRQRAMQLALLNERINGETAVDWGLFSRAVPTEELEAATRQWCEQLADGPAKALARTRRLLRSPQYDLAEALEAEARSFSECAGGHEFPEGVRAFLEKRRPDYRASMGEN
ncbi:MAG: enoyl-CoA hydratase [Planctomycetia bacterium]|nr:enoyl-CoA hydratase [Planctomycetia bacterium]NCF98156.1 enoyl-CoA hydratase [Planctomycetia bacterium]NCG12165.1 enoyl-CoA hydratase [Planctomycetia bacterium]NCG55320.1 enoyl-CoA hydratase [Pseudomonadota bacterium]